MHASRLPPEGNSEIGNLFISAHALSDFESDPELHSSLVAFWPKILNLRTINFVASLNGCKVCETICNWQWWQCTAPTARGTGQLTEGEKGASEPPSPSQGPLLCILPLCALP